MSVPPSVCVFCGSRPGIRPAYAADARAMGALLAGRGWRLVYGAGDVGLMGEVAQAAKGSGAMGVIPTHLLGRERDAPGGASLVITETMHERKKVMFTNSDAIVVLAGGIGSLDEFFEVLTWRQLGLHEKPILLLNTEGYWQPLLQLLDHIIAEGFTEASIRDYFEAVADVDTLGARLDAAFA